MTDLRHETLRSLCGAYVSGDLQPAEEADFERHLAGCAECMDECDRLGETSSELALLPAPEIEELLLAAEPLEAPPAEPSEAPAGAGESRRWWLVGSVLAALVVAGLGVGVVVKLAGEPGAPAGRTGQVGSVSAEGTGDAARLAVTADDAGQVHATVSGLAEGERYTLYAIDTEGTNHLVTQWTAGPGAERVVTGKTDVPLAGLASFAVTRGSADSAVVTAKVTR